MNETLRNSIEKQSVSLKFQAAQTLDNIAEIAAAADIQYPLEDAIVDLSELIQDLRDKCNTFEALDAILKESEAK